VHFFFSSRRRHTRWPRDWSSDVCSSDLGEPLTPAEETKVEQIAEQIKTAVKAEAEAEAAFTAKYPGTEQDKANLGELKQAITVEIGRASCRERGKGSGLDGRCKEERDKR